MKTLILILSTLAAAGSDFTASTFFQTPVNLSSGEVKPAGGLNLRGIFWRGWGADVDLIQSATEDTFIDRSAVHIVYSHAIHGPWSAVGFAGYAVDWEDQQHGAEVGAGVEWNFRKMILGLNLRAQRDDEDDWIAVPTICAGWRF